MKTAELRWNATIYAGGTPSKDRADFWEGGTIPWLNSGAVNDWRITEPSALITEEAIASSSARWIPAQSVVIALAGQGRTKGTAARLEVATTCNQSMAAIIPSDRLDYRYLHYVLHSMYEPIRNMAGGDLRDGLNLQHIGDIRIPVMPLEEQRRIADFLDDQVTRIGSITSAREKQIGLVRAAYESDVASLLASVDSVQQPLNRFLRMSPTYGVLKPEPFDGPDGVPLLRIFNLEESGRYDFDELMRISPEQAAEFRRTRVQLGDVLVSVVGTVGRAALVDGPLAGANLSRAIALLRPTVLAHGPVMMAWIRSPQFKRFTDLTCQGTAQAVLNMGDLARFPIAIPATESKVEALANNFERLSIDLERSLRALQVSTELLADYRRSLITAAVMGELHVATARRGVPE